MFFVDTVLYFFLTLYIEAVFPEEYGIPQKWYFPFSSNYWLGNKQNLDHKVLPHEQVVNEFLDVEPKHLETGINVIKLSKTYDGKKFAVKDLNLNAYKGQISALLGHNGAGKTTTMSLITGLFPPSSGTAIVNGFDIMKDMDRVRDSLGICPQFDILFDELTVEEHLRFFCLLKKFDKKKLREEITHTIKVLGLEDKINKTSNTLSGGQKRKLSVGIALIGNSEIVILDEPTSGMDVYARRFTWDRLLAEKANRTILLTTHFMEEADKLSERIAFMSNGELQCCGSPLFLKKKHGIGYTLTIVKTCDSTAVKPITQLIETQIKDPKLKTNDSTQICYSLTHENSQHFEYLFQQIESKKEELGIESYGISITTLEDVFLKVGEYAEEGVEALDSNQKDNNKGLSLQLDNKRNIGLSLIGQQFYGLLSKKVLYSVRSLTLTLSQVPWLQCQFQ